MDAAGNLLARPGLSLSYDDWSRLRTATANGVTTTYGVNGLNERVSKTDGTTRRVFVYAGVGHLLGVYDGTTGAAIEELAYLGERPVATVRSGTIYPIETDHLMAPLRVLDGTNTVVWSWEDREPFGASAPTTSGFTFNLRFPGQWTDGETGLVSNGFRDYDPVMGRYVEVDPAGLVAGTNLYLYVNGSPEDSADPYGLWAFVFQYYRIFGGGISISGEGIHINSFSGRAGIGLGGGLALNPAGEAPDPRAACKSNSIGVNVEGVVDVGVFGVGAGVNYGGTMNPSNALDWNKYGGLAPGLSGGKSEGVKVLYGGEIEASATLEITHNF